MTGFDFMRHSTVLLLVVALLVGCGPKPVDLVPTSGSVTVGGPPAPHVKVRLMPHIMEGNSGPTSSGITNEAGEFLLTTDDGRPGAVLGPHVAVLFDMDEERPEQGQTATRPPRFSASYSTAAGGLKVQVVANQPVELKVP